MQKEQKNKKKGNANSQGGISDRLTKGFMKVALLGSVASILGCVAIFFISSQYSDALVNYGFSQGDIGKAMSVLTESRSSLRGAIGYDDQDAIDTVMDTYDVKKDAFWDYMADVETGCVSDSEKSAYNEIIETANQYWALADEIIEAGNSTNAAENSECAAA